LPSESLQPEARAINGAFAPVHSHRPSAADAGRPRSRRMECSLRRLRRESRSSRTGSLVRRRAPRCSALRQRVGCSTDRHRAPCWPTIRYSPTAANCPGDVPCCAWFLTHACRTPPRLAACALGAERPADLLRHARRSRIALPRSRPPASRSRASRSWRSARSQRGACVACIAADYERPAGVRLTTEWSLSRAESGGQSRALPCAGCAGRGRASVLPPNSAANFTGSNRSRKLRVQTSARTSACRRSGAIPGVEENRQPIHSQLTTHNSQLTTHNSQLTTHNCLSLLASCIRCSCALKAGPIRGART